MARLWLALLMVLSFGVSAGEEPEQLPVRRLQDGETFKLDIYSLTRPVVCSFTDGEERNTVLLEVHPDGYVRVVRVFGIVKFGVPVRGADMTFSMTTGQRVGVWSMSNLEVSGGIGALSIRLTPPTWAVAIEAEFGGVTGIMVRYRGREGVLFTGQRMDSLLSREGDVLLARSGKGLKPETSVPEPREVTGPEEVSDLEQPGAYKPPKGWHKKPDWTSLPLLPTVVEPARPPIVSP